MVHTKTIVMLKINDFIFKKWEKIIKKFSVLSIMLFSE